MVGVLIQAPFISLFLQIPERPERIFVPLEPKLRSAADLDKAVSARSDLHAASLPDLQNGIDLLVFLLALNRKTQVSDRKLRTEKRIVRISVFQFRNVGGIVVCRQRKRVTDRRLNRLAVNSRAVSRPVDRLIVFIHDIGIFRHSPEGESERRRDCIVGGVVKRIIRRHVRAIVLDLEIKSPRQLFDMKGQLLVFDLDRAVFVGDKHPRGGRAAPFGLRGIRA